MDNTDQTNWVTLRHVTATARDTYKRLAAEADADGDHAGRLRFEARADTARDFVALMDMLDTPVRVAVPA